MKKVAVIIKHPGRDWEGDVRVDIMEVPEDTTYDEIRDKVQAEMLGPFKVLYVTEKITFERKLSRSSFELNKQKPQPPIQ